jgi:hypothetical protein
MSGSRDIIKNRYHFSRFIAFKNFKPCKGFNPLQGLLEITSTTTSSAFNRTGLPGFCKNRRH